MTTILEALQNANSNINSKMKDLGIELAKLQLNKAVSLLEKGYPLSTDIESILHVYGDLWNVPKYSGEVENVAIEKI